MAKKLPFKLPHFLEPIEKLVSFFYYSFNLVEHREEIFNLGKEFYHWLKNDYKEIKKFIWQYIATGGSLAITLHDVFALAITIIITVFITIIVMKFNRRKTKSPRVQRDMKPKIPKKRTPPEVSKVQKGRKKTFLDEENKNSDEEANNKNKGDDDPFPPMHVVK